MKKNICKAMVLMSVALMSISPVMAESNDDVMVISENSQAKKVDDVIIIDDGSTDNSGEICDYVGYAKSNKGF